VESVRKITVYLIIAALAMAPFRLTMAGQVHGSENPVDQDILNAVAAHNHCNHSRDSSPESVDIKQDSVNHLDVELASAVTCDCNENCGNSCCDAGYAPMLLPNVVTSIVIIKSVDHFWITVSSPGKYIPVKTRPPRRLLST
jgi:hypothetical protein